MKLLKKLYYRLIPTYKILEEKYVTYKEDDKMIRESMNKSDSEKWVLSPNEDSNIIIGMVYLCKNQNYYEIQIEKWKNFKGWTYNVS